MSYGCYNRGPFRQSSYVQDGWRIRGEKGTREPVMVLVENRMSKPCQYTKDDRYDDQQCVGCSHHIVKAGATHEKV